MSLSPLAPPVCLHRVISALPDSPLATCLECGEDVDVDVVERQWQQEADRTDN